MIFETAYEANDVIFYERNDSEAQNFHDKKLRPMGAGEGAATSGGWIAADCGRGAKQDGPAEMFPAVKPPQQGDLF